MNEDTFKLAILDTHPIQYYAPRYRAFDRCSQIEVTVFYCSNRGVEVSNDQNFGGIEFEWDISLLEGYEHQFLFNLAPDDKSGFFGEINPGIITELIQGEFDALSVRGHNFLTCHLAIATAKIIDVPLFMTADTHLMLDRHLIKRALRKPVLRLFYSQFHGFLANGTKNSEFFRSLGISEDRIFHVPHTVDNRRFQSNALEAQEVAEFKKKLDIEPSAPVILYVSSFRTQKRPGDLIRAFDELVSTGRQAHLVFVGDGTEHDNVRTYAKRNGLDHKVVFAGFQNQSELPKWYSIGDIFVLPSENESWAVVVNEAMNFGMPVIATSEVGAAYDLVEPDETGYRYPTGDIPMLTDCLQRLIDDPDLRERMGKNALERIDNWSYDQAVQGMLKALQSTE